VWLLALLGQSGAYARQSKIHFLAGCMRTIDIWVADSGYDKYVYDPIIRLIVEVNEIVNGMDL
jgi:hypothetical protein